MSSWFCFLTFPCRLASLRITKSKRDVQMPPRVRIWYCCLQIFPRQYLLVFVDKSTNHGKPYFISLGLSLIISFRQRHLQFVRIILRPMGLMRKICIDYLRRLEAHPVQMIWVICSHTNSCIVDSNYACIHLFVLDIYVRHR